MQIEIDFGKNSERANVQDTLEVSANLFENCDEGLYANTGAQSATLKATNNTFTNCTTGSDCRGLSSVEVDTNTVKNSNYGLYFENLLASLVKSASRHTRTGERLALSLPED